MASRTGGASGSLLAAILQRAEGAGALAKALEDEVPFVKEVISLSNVEFMEGAPPDDILVYDLLTDFPERDMRAEFPDRDREISPVHLRDDQFLETDLVLG